jgi:tetratricopeptide (TPR) repeat protein
MRQHSDTYKLSIVQVSPPANMVIGDYMYRIGQPAEAMAQIPGVIVINTSTTSPFLNELCLSADVVVLHLVGEQDLLPIIAERKAQGLPTVYEISDNFMAFPSWVPVKPWFNDPVNLATVFQLIQLSDAIQGVSEILLQQFRFLKERQVVFENQIMEIGSILTASQKELVMGWAGSLGHTEDVKWIVPVIQDICGKYPHVRFAFMGNQKQYEELFGRNPKFSYRRPGTLSEYYNFLDGLDIGFAPLINTPYNVCRSDIKFVEYASRGVAPVLSDTGPYKWHARHKDNAFLFKSPLSLRNILEELIDDNGLLQRVRRNAYDYVMKERMEKDHAMERISFYEGIGKVHSTRPLPLHLLERSSAGIELYQPKQTRAEWRVIEGVCAEAKGHSEHARALWMEAASDAPGYYFPLLCTGRNLMERDAETAADYLGKALSLNPKSIHARLLLGQTLKSEHTDVAREEFEKVLKVFPYYAPAWIELALLEKEKGHLDDAGRLMNRALEANPFCAKAAFELGKIYREQGNQKLALAAFRVAADLIPDNFSYQMSIMEGQIGTYEIGGAIRECIDYLRRFPNYGEMYQKIMTILGSRVGQKEESLVGKVVERHQ